jgi:hypothetical protein
VIIKNHGTVDEPARLIFTRTDYAKAREAHKDFYAIMDALALTHTCLFLGCGLDDPDMRLMLEGYAFRHQFGRPHFFVLPKKLHPKCVRDVIQASMNIEILEYSDANNHAKLKDAIDELKIQVDSGRAGLKMNMRW